MSNILLRNFTSSSTEYVPYTGATTDVDLGSNNLLTSGYVGINVSSPSKTLDVDGTFNLSGACYINIPAGVDDSVVVLDSSGSIKTDEIDTRVWGSTLLDSTDLANYVPYTGATANVDITPYYFTSGGSVSGQSTFQSGLVVNDSGGSSDDDDFRIESVSCTSAFRVDASANDVIVNTDIILNNVSASTDNTVLILSSSNTVVSDEIDSRVWGSTLVDMINGLNNRVVTSTDSNSLNAEANLIFDGSTLSITGATPIKTDGIGADTDNTVVIVNSSDEFKTDEIDSRVWGSSLVDYTGTPVDNQVALWTDTNTVEGNNSFTYDGSTVSIDGDTPILLPSIGADTDNTVVILNGSNQLKTDEIDSRVWGSSLVDMANGVDNRVVTATDSNSLNGESNLIFDGSTLSITGDTPIKTDGIGSDTDNTVVIVNSSDEFKTDEIDSRVWGSSLVDYTGTPIDNQISVWTDTNTVEGNNSFTYDGSTVSISGSSPITVADIGTDTDNTVVIVNSSGSFKTDEIDSRVWGSTLANLTNGSNDRVVTATDSNSLNGESNLRFDGTDLYVNGNIGIGDSSPDCELVVKGDVVVGTHTYNDKIQFSSLRESDGSENAKAGDFSCVFTGSGNTSQGINGLNCWCKTDSKSVGNLTQTLYGGGLRNRYVVYHEGDGTVTKGSALSSQVATYGNGDLTYGVCFNSETPVVNNGTTVSAFVNFFVEGGGGSVDGTITNNYGLYINDLDTGTNRYAIYTGEDDVYFGGDVGIGDSSPDCKLDVVGAIASGTLSFGTAGPTDDLDVSEVNIIFINASRNSVTIGGTTGGVSGQVLHIACKDIAAGNSVTIEHAESTGNQDFYTASGADESLTNSYGGWTFVCDGSNWYSVNGN